MHVFPSVLRGKEMSCSQEKIAEYLKKMGGMHVIENDLSKFDGIDYLFALLTKKTLNASLMIPNHIDKDVLDTVLKEPFIHEYNFGGLNGVGKKQQAVLYKDAAKESGIICEITPKYDVSLKGEKGTILTFLSKMKMNQNKYAESFLSDAASRIAFKYLKQKERKEDDEHHTQYLDKIDNMEKDELIDLLRTKMINGQPFGQYHSSDRYQKPTRKKIVERILRNKDAELGMAYLMYFYDDDVDGRVNKNDPLFHIVSREYQIIPSRI